MFTFKLREVPGDSPGKTVKAEPAGKKPLGIRRNAFADSSAPDWLAVSSDVQDHVALVKLLYYRNSGVEGKRNVTKRPRASFFREPSGRSDSEYMILSSNEDQRIYALSLVYGMRASSVWNYPRQSERQSQ